MRDSQIMLKVNNLGKCFHMYEKPGDRLKQVLLPGKRQYYHEFWALHDINFTIKKGESFGIIGRNGSGKSTLLQLLCKTLTPTMGNVEVSGRIAALLELGAGFNPEFTGKENVFMNGAILGFSHKEISALFEEIAAFADIGDFINQPVKTYSSGMFVRLAFAVQAHVNPDILIIDEALSVGDIFFQQKCAKRMEYLREQGTTLIFVSHDMGIVRDLCENAIYLKAGKMLFLGSSIEAIRRYHGEATDHYIPKASNLSDLSIPSLKENDSINQFKEIACWINQISNLIHQRAAKLIAIAITDSNDMPTMKIQMGEKLILRILYQSFTDKPIHITISIRNRYDHIINASGTYTKNVTPPVLKIGAFAIFELQIDCMLEAGNYTFCAFLSSEIIQPNRAQAIDQSPWLGPITITWDYDNQKAPWLGMFGLPVNALIHELQE